MSKNDSFLKKYIIPNLPYVLVFWFACKLAESYRLASGDTVQKIMQGFSSLGEVMANPLPSFVPFDMLIGLAGAAIIYIIVYVKKKNAKKWRKDEEYGSARWGI
jgi:type IV secretion system protein VirD4